MASISFADVLAKRDERGALRLPMRDAAEPSESAADSAVVASFTVKQHKRAILVTGDTLSVREQLKELGGRWNRTLGGWVFRPSAHDAVISMLHEDPARTVDQCTDAVPSAALLWVRGRAIVRPASATITAADVRELGELVEQRCPVAATLARGGCALEFEWELDTSPSADESGSSSE